MDAVPLKSALKKPLSAQEKRAEQAEAFTKFQESNSR